MRGEYESISTIERWNSLLFPLILSVVDYLAVVCGVGMAYGLRKYILPGALDSFHINSLYIVVVLPLVFLLFLHINFSYERNAPYWVIGKRVFIATLYSLIMAVFLMYFTHVAEDVSRLFVVLAWVLSYICIVSFRFVTESILSAYNWLYEPVLILGAGKTSEALIKVIEGDSGYRYKIIGFLEDTKEVAPSLAKYPILGGFKDAQQVIKKTGVKTVLISAPGLGPKALTNLINRIEPLVKNVSFVPDFMGAPVGNLQIQGLLEARMMVVQSKNNLARWYNRWAKRIFDLVVALLSLVIIIPVCIVIGAIIYKTDPGPIFFAHKRIGKNGKEFPCYKFRSMVVNSQEMLEKYLEENPEAREEWESDFKLKNDPRVTKIGAFLRRTSLDELPQIFNVIKGEMSFVGPRPIIQAEVEKYGEYFHDFCMVTPGITGLWQVSGRSDTTYEERVSMDSWYVHNWSVWMDVVYLIKTVKVVLKKEGAY